MLGRSWHAISRGEDPSPAAAPPREAILGARNLFQVGFLLTITAAGIIFGCGGETTGGGASANGAGATGGVQGTGGGSYAGGSAGCPGTGGPTMVRLPEGYCIDSTVVTVEQYQTWLDMSPALPNPSDADCGWNTSFTPTHDWPYDGTRSDYPSPPRRLFPQLRRRHPGLRLRRQYKPRLPEQHT
jgi:hypothetical protein